MSIVLRQHPEHLAVHEIVPGAAQHPCRREPRGRDGDLPAGGCRTRFRPRSTPTPLFHSEAFLQKNHLSVFREGTEALSPQVTVRPPVPAPGPCAPPPAAGRPRPPRTCRGPPPPREAGGRRPVPGVRPEPAGAAGGAGSARAHPAALSHDSAAAAGLSSAGAAPGGGGGTCRCRNEPAAPRTLRPRAPARPGPRCGSSAGPPPVRRSPRCAAAVLCSRG